VRLGCTHLVTVPAESSMHARQRVESAWLVQFMWAHKAPAKGLKIESIHPQGTGLLCSGGGAVGAYNSI
jgi:predicted acylesterase/phospholipase RssA